MFRSLANLVVGRKKTIDTSIAYQGVLSIINQLRGKQLTDGISVIGHNELTRFRLQRKTPAEVLSFLNENFEPFRASPIPGWAYETYCEGGHRVYRKDGTEKHYITLWYGQIYQAESQRGVFGIPFRDCSLEFLVSEQ